LSDANVSQWLSETLSTIFDFDFLNYDTKRLSFEPYFTEDGWKKYNELLNTFFPANGIQTSKAVLSGSAYGGPVILNQGPLSTKKYAWWIQMPIRITFSGYNRNFKQIFVLQALIVRIPTVDNLSGVAIDNLIVVSQRQDNTGMLNQ
jgi:hypothetical protein